MSISPTKPMAGSDSMGVPSPLFKGNFSDLSQDTAASFTQL